MLDTAIQRDRWGRPLIIPPQGGKAIAYTRASSLGKALEDTSNLADWKARMVALGLAKRPDLLSLVAHADPDDRKTLNDTCEQAKEAAGASTAANTGTAIHAMLENLDRGLVATATNDDERKALVAWAAMKDYYSMSMRGIEEFVVNDKLQAAGTFDRIVEMDGKRYVADLKTGATITYSSIAWSVQLAVYAYGVAYSPDGTRSHLGVDLKVGLVMHLPVGADEVTVYEVDLVEGARLAELAVAVRESRTKHRQPKWRKLASEPQAVAMIADAFPGAVDVTKQQLIDRVEAIKAAGHTATLATHWPDDIPKKNASWTDDHLPFVRMAIVKTEREHRMPFMPEPVPEPKPAPEVVGLAANWLLPENDDADPGVVKALKDKLAHLEPEHKARADQWAKEANRSGNSISISRTPTRRKAEIVRAVLAWCAFDDAVMREALITVIGDDRVQPGFPVGAILGSLTLDEATRLADA